MADLTVSSDIDTFMASANFAAARTNLGLELGSDIQAYDAQLEDIAGLATTDGGFIVGNGSTFVLESGATARTSLGLGSIAVLSAPSGTVVGTSDSQTLTNKTIDGDSNTLSNLDIGNEVDWAAAADVADAGTPASGDKLLLFEAGVGLRKIDWDDLPSGGGGGGSFNSLVDDTTPQLGGQLDVNGNAIGDGTLELLAFTETGSAVNHVNITNAATGNGPLISAVGDDTNIDLDLTGKGTGAVAIRNGTTAQTFNVYNTYTASDNFERLEIKWDANVAVIGTAKGASGGTQRNIALKASGVTVGNTVNDATLYFANSNHYIQHNAGGIEIVGNLHLGLKVTGGRTDVYSDTVVLRGSLPTSDPTVAGQLWNDSGTLKISAG